jgi:dipeptidyl aminopeptidase/acylaminoacyl peptidase
MIPIQPDDLYRMKFLQGGTLSPDGKRVVYALTHVDAAKDAELCALYEMDIASGATRALTDGTAFDTEPRFSPDGRRLVFRSNRSGADQIYLMDAGGGEVRAITALGRGVGASFDWSADGKFIAFSAPPEKEVVNLHVPYRLTRHIYRMDGMGYVDNAVNSIYIVEVETGAVTRLTNDRCHNTNPRFSPDGAEILFETSIFPDSHRFFPALRIVDLKGNVSDIMKDWGYARAGAWSHDGRQIVFVGNPIEARFGQHNLVWTIDRAGGTPECRTPNAGAVNFGGELQPDIPVMGLSEPTIHVTPDEVAYTRAQVGGEMRAYRINLRGEISFRRVFEAGERSDVVLEMRAGKILFGVATINDPLNLGVADENGGNERIITDTNGDLLRERKLARIEHFFCKNEDGTPLECWLMLPAEGSAPYPTIQYIHGGPHQGWGQIYVFDAQMLAGAGYAVLLVNYRGSTGYGDEFAFAADGKQGPTEHSDLMCALDYVVEKGWADPNRLGTAGLSYGGYLSNWAIGHTDRYKAAVVENGVASRINSYGAADIGVYSLSNEMRAHLRDAPEAYWKSSPIAYAHLAKTPTLLIQSEHDWRVPAAQAEEMYGNLKVNGGVVEMLRLPYMPHMGSLGGPLYIRRAQNEALLDWMNRYVLGRAPKGGIA